MKKLLLVLLVLFGLQTQAQITACDSIEYTYLSGSGGNTTLQLNGIINGVCPVSFPCTVLDWEWQACNANLCFFDTGQVVTFCQFNTTDTIKVCLLTVLDINNVWWTCVQCDSLVYGLNGGMKMGALTSIKEVKMNIIKDNRMYNLLGKEIFEIPKGIIYIKNRKKYIK